MAKTPVPEPQNSNPSIAANITGAANCFDAHYLQTLDNDTASSILEFILRQRLIPEYVVNAVFLALPLVNPISSSLKKAILFRRLASELVLRSVSEETLNIFELIEELDRENGHFPPSEAMKTAYCSVALSCTAAALRQNMNDFLDSFHRIWVQRISDIEMSAAASLISEEFREVRDILWEAVKDPEIRPLVVNVDLEETLDLVRDYLEEVWDMEPLFPEVAVDGIEEIKADLRVPGERRERAILDSDYEYGGQLDHDKGLEISVENEQDLKSSDPDRQRMVQDTHLDPGNKATGLLAKNSEQACNREFKENNDFDDLQRMVQNTLLDASNKAIEVQTVNSEDTCSVDIRENDVQNRRDDQASTSIIGTQDTSIEGNEASAMLNKKPSCLKGKEENQNRQGVPDGENYSTLNTSNSNSLPRASIMERNPTAHTLEWTDSPSREGRLHLHSPKREHVSPLKLIDAKKFAKRRKIRRWTLLEEETLLKAVREHGKGSWKVILSSYPNIFEERTEVDLKDKWRNMTRSNWPS